MGYWVHKSFTKETNNWPSSPYVEGNGKTIHQKSFMFSLYCKCGCYADNSLLEASLNQCFMLLHLLTSHSFSQSNLNINSSLLSIILLGHVYMYIHFMLINKLIYRRNYRFNINFRSSDLVFFFFLIKVKNQC